MHIRRALGATPMAMFLALSITAPTGAQSPGPARSADPLAPVWVTGRVQGAPSCEIPPSVMSNGVEEYRGHRCAPQTWVMSDSRLSGSAVATWNADLYSRVPGTDPTGSVVSVWSGTYEVTNDAGSWSCWFTGSLGVGPGRDPAFVNPDTLMCEGHGEYDGLMAVLVLEEGDAMAGLVISREIPPIP